MLLLIKFAAKVFSILNGEVSPRQIAAGLAAGVWIGLIPIGSLLATLLMVLCLIVNVNLAMLAVAAGLLKIFAFLVDPLANRIGFALLTKTPFLTGFWTRLYNMPVVPYTKFNNTIVLGSFLIGLVLLIPVYFLAKVGVVRYRSTWRQKILSAKVVQVIQASSFYKYYLTYKGIRGG